MNNSSAYPNNGTNLNLMIKLATVMGKNGLVLKLMSMIITSGEIGVPGPFREGKALLRPFP